MGLAISDETIAAGGAQPIRTCKTRPASSAARCSIRRCAIPASANAAFSPSSARSICASRSNSRWSTASTRRSRWSRRWRAPRRRRARSTISCCPRARPAIFPPRRRTTLKAYYDDRKASWRAPEYRAIDILLVTPASLAKPSEVSDEDAKADYEKEKDTRFTTPEKRKLQQIVFPTEAEAAEAEAKIKAGASFDDIAKARNLTAADIDLGEVTKADIFDHAIGDAAFALPARRRHRRR